MNKADFDGTESLMSVSFSVTIRGETFHVSVTVNLSAGEVVGGLKQMFTSEGGQRRAVFIFRRGLGYSDSAISMHIKLLNAQGETEEVWHAVVSLSGTILHLHPR